MSGYTLPWFLQQFRDFDGKILSGGKLYFYVAGSTSLPKNVYTDFACTNPITQPLVLDAAGQAQQYFAEAGLYKIMLLDMNDDLIATRDNVSGSGTGGEGGDTYMVKVNGGDSTPDFLEQKVIGSSSVSVTVIEGASKHLLLETIESYKVKADPSDPTPDFLDAKVENGYYIEMWVNPTTHRIQSNFTGPAYVPQTGGIYTGPVTIPTLTSTTSTTGTLTVSGNAAVTGTLTTGVINANSGTITNATVGTLTISGATGLGNKMLMVNSSGAVYRGTDPYTVKISSGDPTPGYLSTKIYPGAGIAINVSNDPINGDNINISLIEPPLALPVGEVCYGSGTGVTSSSRLVYTQPGTAAATLMVDKTELDTYYLGGVQYTSWSNYNARLSNFPDAINQKDNGNICIGGGGDSGVIKCTASTRAVDFGLFSTVSVFGKLVPPGTDSSGTTDTVPELTVPGEVKVVRFVNTSGTTLTSNATQTTHYRSSTTGVSSIAAASAQVDGAGVFGKGGTGKVASVIFICVDATTVQAHY